MSKLEKRREYMREYMKKRRKAKDFRTKEQKKKQEKIACVCCGKLYSRGYMYKHKQICSPIKEKVYTEKELNDMTRLEFLTLITQIKAHKKK